MQEIQTIIANHPHHFDEAVNEAMAAGWELVRRECFITGSDRATTFYAELERTVAEPVEDLEEFGDFADWEITRDPYHPYRCSHCGYKAKEQWAICPGCKTLMRDEE